MTRSFLLATQVSGGRGGLLFLTGCFWDNGHLYRADQPSPSPGLRCLNWLNAPNSLASAPESGECPSTPGGGRAAAAAPAPTQTHCAFSPLSGAGNHSYCRNPDRDPRGPWCYVSGEAGAPEKRPCEDMRCPGNRIGPREPHKPPRPGHLGAAVTAATHVRPHDADWPSPAPAPSDWPGLSPGRRA